MNLSEIDQKRLVNLSRLPNVIAMCTMLIKGEDLSKTFLNEIIRGIKKISKNNAPFLKVS